MEPDRSRLGRVVRERRNALRLTQRQAAVAADVANQTWINVEQGEPVKDSTLAGVDVAMGWAPGSASKVLEGGDAREIDSAAEPKPSVEDRLERIERMVEQLLAERHGAGQN